METQKLKNKQIGQKRRETNDRHRNMVCKVFDVKIQQNKLNKQQKECLSMYFVEAKWIYNYILNLSQQEDFDVFSFNYKQHPIITRLSKDKQPEEKEIKYLPAQCYQELSRYLKLNIISLSKKKQKGYKVGKLKFKSNYNSIDLRQYNTSYKIINQNKIKICGIKGNIKVNGLKQIPKNVEFANAKLVKKADGYHIIITTYQQKQKIINKKSCVGIDFGLKDTITTSGGKKYEKIFIEEPVRLKRLQRKILRNPNKTSNNKYKLRQQLQKQYQKLTNRKKDIANKIVADLLSTYQTIYMQDELIKLWHRRYGKQIQHSCLGLIKQKLKQSNRVVLIESSFPSTKLCYNCGNKLSISLNQRTYTCPVCGLSEERDLKAAKTILLYGLNKIGVEHTELTPLENPSATHGIIYHEQLGSLNWEATNL